MAPRLVLASTSPYRAAVLRDAGIDFRAEAPSVDERALDHRFGELGPDGYVLELAAAKARSVLERLVASGGIDGAEVVVGCDQIAVLPTGDGPRLLHQPGTPQRAVAQLMAMSGSRHELVNGVVALRVADRAEAAEIDRHVIRMRPFSVEEATAYVERFAPLDCAGSYRIEDDADLVVSVEGEDRSGIIGLPLPTLGRLLQRLAIGDDRIREV